MNNSTVRTVLSDGHSFTECPRWHDGRLWFVDMHVHQVVSLDEQGHKEAVAEVPGRVGGIGWLPDGRLLVVAQDDRQILRLDPGGLTVHADLSEVTAEPLNDMWVDSSGRAYVGEMGFDVHHFLEDEAVLAALTADWVEAQEVPTLGRLFAVEPDGTWQVAASGLSFPNGIIVDEQSSRLIVAETFGASLSVFDVAADGSLANRQVWPIGFPPDGIAFPDAEGHVWAADPFHSAVRRVASGGDESARIDTDQLCMAAGIGGPDGHSLFLCTAPVTEPQQALKLRGAQVEVVRVAVPAAGEPGAPTLNH